MLYIRFITLFILSFLLNFLILSSGMWGAPGKGSDFWMKPEKYSAYVTYQGQQVKICSSVKGRKIVQRTSGWTPLGIDNIQQVVGHKMNILEACSALFNTSFKNTLTIVRSYDMCRHSFCFELKQESSKTWWGLKGFRVKFSRRKNTDCRTSQWVKWSRRICWR